MADDRAFDVLKNFLIGFVLVMVCVDVDDEKILKISSASLLRRVLEVLGGGIIVEIELAHLARQRVHGFLRQSRAIFLK